MIRIKEELCLLLLNKNHTLFKLADDQLLDRIKNGVYGNLLEPCPFIVSVTVNSLLNESQSNIIFIGT